jgi:putative AdoMet-dependent methyltransferase
MKSQYLDKYNHNPIASEYDKNVSNEDNPIRTGYGLLLGWVKEKAKNSKIIIDLGCGTGNTVKHLINFEKIICVDISENMLKIAERKLKNKNNIIFIKSDLLSYIHDNKDNQEAGTIISTYAIHHLTQKEKHNLFKQAFDFLQQGGKMICGDLMFENTDQEYEMKEKYPDLVKDFDDEYYWYLDEEVKKLEEIGFIVETTRFSDLSWGIYSKKP